MAFTSSFLITTEYTRVLHSQLFSDYVSVLAGQGETRDRIDNFTIDDANEFHLGAEYLVPVKGRPAIRFGIWFDPDHSVHYAPTPANDLLDERIGIALSSGRDLWHYTGGTMVAVHPRIDSAPASTGQRSRREFQRLQSSISRTLYISITARRRTACALPAASHECLEAPVRFRPA